MTTCYKQLSSSAALAELSNIQKYLPGILRAVSVMKGSLGFCVLAAIHWLSITADASAGRLVPSDGKCGPPPVIPHGILCGVRASAPQGSVVTYQCDSGYALIGPEERRCESGRWSGREPRCVCGKSGAGRYRRIVNGRNSRRNEHPWQAMIAHRMPDGQFLPRCGGTLISEQWLTTAAHCVVQPGSTNPLSEDNLKVYLGKYHRDINRDDQFVQEFTVSEIRVHPNYDNLLLDSDIALIKLSRPAYLSERVMPVCLAENSVEGVNLTETLIRPGSLVTVAGWGQTDAGTDADILQTTRLMTINNTQCEDNYAISGVTPLVVTTNQFCAGFDDGHADTCFGDNGGAAIAAAGRGGDRRWYLVGVTSWWSPSNCGVPLQYSGFTRVSKFLNFISSVTRR